MKHELDRETMVHSHQRKRRNRRRTTLLVLGCLVLAVTVSALSLPAITMERRPICGLEEHTHGPECYREERVLICGYPEPAAEETSPPEASSADLTLPEQPVTEPEVTVPVTEAPIPLPTQTLPPDEPASVMAEETLPETQPAETALPSETDGEASPPPAESTLPPEESEPLPSETAPEETLPPETSAPPEETVHVHTDACYEIRRVLICGKQEHTHTDACFEQSDPFADTETPSDWESSLSRVTPGGQWAEDLVALARTQLGYQESTRNFIWDEEGQKLGYSRYGAWYGSPYGDWCAMFLSFCLHYAGVPEAAIPAQASCPTWVQQLTELGIYRTEGLPAPGDLLFLDHDADGSADHVALVEEAADGRICTIEGNCADAVRQMKYDETSPLLLGYCPVGQVQQRLNAVPEQQTYTLTFTDQRMTVTLTLTGLPTLLPEDAVLEVWELTADNAPQAYEAAKSAGEATLAEDHTVSSLTVFDFAVFSGAEQLDIPRTAQAVVEVLFHTPPFDSEILNQGGTLQPLILEDLSPELLPALRPAPAPEPDQTDAEIEPRDNGFVYRSRGLAPFAVMLSSHTETGTFWKVCRNLQSGEEFQTGARYLVVSAEGNYALANSNPNCTRIELQPVKGNPDYYTVDRVPANAIWIYEYNFLNGGTRALYQTLRPGWNPVRSYVNPGNQYLFQNSAVNLGFEKSNNSACFGLHNGQFFLNFNGTNQYYLTSNTRWLYGNQDSYQYARTSDILILKQVDATLTIPEDATAPDGGTGQIGSAVKPAYGAYIEPSGEITGSYEDETARVDYASDPATTKIEQHFGAHPLNGGTDFNAQKSDNGKVMTDKSVLYGRDDYEAFSHYDDGVFSTALSALGQAFVVDQSVTKVPIDVLLILDLSNSMNETDINQSSSRAQILVSSINRTIDNIMKAHPENRVCAVGYNSGAYDLLELGHYQKDRNGRYFEYTIGDNDEFGNPRISIRATVSPTRPTPTQSCRAGTYTQMGIARGYDLLMRNTPNPADTTYTTTVAGQTVTQPRKPVIILVSDGEPTHCTSHYMDVLRNPYYGDGLGPISNGKGIHGYYTILSANYYKRMVGIHYNNPAAMYTVAFGMKEDDSSVLDGSAATNHYRATVMNPTESNINTLDTIASPNGKLVEKALFRMLRGTHNGLPPSVGCSWDLIPELGDPHCYVPVLTSNPYQGNYAYADRAYLNNSGNDGLDAAFDEIIKLSTVYDFSFETRNKTPLVLTDPIGSGMEVRGDPVLRINGRNYTPAGKTSQGNDTVYTYSGVVPMDPYTGRMVDLSTITVRISSGQGQQTVTMEIPPQSLPTYTADPTLSFFHEALPIRLLYQVGLSPAGQAEVDALQPGQTKIFYTNRHTDGDHAGAVLQPSGKDPYYRQQAWQAEYGKTSNPTGTAQNALVIGGTAQQVDFLLGNNGRLVITKKEPPLPPVEPVSVQKHWQRYNGDPLESDLPPSITARLYRTWTSEAGESVTEEVLTFTLTAADGWKKTFTPEQLQAVPGREYRYYVEEVPLPDYLVSYSGDGVPASTPKSPILITNRYRYGDVVLPATGGPGPFLYIGSGLALMAGALILYASVSEQKRRERRNKTTS